MPISTINTNSIADDAVTVPKVTDQVLTHRNLIINGAMNVAQRGTSFTNPAVSAYTLDRWYTLNSNDSTVDVSQSTEAPTGFKNSLKIDVTTADSSMSAAQYYILAQGIEGQNLTHLNYGSADAKEVTISFWVRSNKTGTYYVEIQTSGSQELARPYTINTANTWEHKTLTWIANTDYTISENNGAGLRAYWWLAAGSNYTGSPIGTTWVSNTNRVTGQTNFLDSTSNEFYITGVQMEVGDTATPFEHRSFGDELAKCKRYFERFERQRPGAGSAGTTSLWAGPARSGASNVQGPMHYVEKRNNPTISVSSAGHLNAIYPISPFNAALSGFGIDGNAGTQSAYINATGSGSPGSDCASFVYIGNAAGYLDIDAEL